MYADFTIRDREVVPDRPSVQISQSQKQEKSISTHEIVRNRMNGKKVRGYTTIFIGLLK